MKRITTVLLTTLLMGPMNASSHDPDLDLDRDTDSTSCGCRAETFMKCYSKYFGRVIVPRISHNQASKMCFNLVDDLCKSR